MARWERSIEIEATPAHVWGVMADVSRWPEWTDSILSVEDVTRSREWAASLRLAFASGEALPGALGGRWRALTGVPLHNLYGPTEAAVDVTWHDPAGGMPEAGTVPIGSLVRSTSIRPASAKATTNGGEAR